MKVCIRRIVSCFVRSIGATSGLREQKVAKGRRGFSNRDPSLFLIFVSVLTLGFANRAVALPPSLPEVVKAWESQEADTVSVRARIDQSKVVFKGAFVGEDRGPDGTIVDRPYPDEDTEVRNQLLVVYDRSRIRWELTGTELGLQGKVKQSMKIAFDGREETLLDGSRTPPFAIIHNEVSKDRTQMRNTSVRPLLFALFPATTAREFVDENCTVSLKDAVDQSDLIVVESLSKTRPYRSAELWVNPKYGMRIDRVLSYIEGKPSIDHRIEYKQDANQRLVPARWESTWYFQGSGKPRSTSKGAVHSLEMNPVLTAATFQIEIPPGALVYDYKTSADYILLANGALREITHAELKRGATYEDLLNSESGKAKLEE